MSGVWRRRIPAAKTERRPQVEPLARADDDGDADERQEGAEHLDRARGIGPDRHGEERGQDGGGGDEQGGITGRDRLEREGPDDLVAAEADDAEQGDLQGVGPRQADRPFPPAQQGQQ
jgi:hypothetical protein